MNRKLYCMFITRPFTSEIEEVHAVRRNDIVPLLRDMIEKWKPRTDGTDIDIFVSSRESNAAWYANCPQHGSIAKLKVLNRYAKRVACITAGGTVSLQNTDLYNGVTK